MLLQDISQITSDYQHIYLSPHFDDVVFSCGATILRQRRASQSVLIITVFGGLPSTASLASPFALQLHQEMKLSPEPINVVEERRQEDSNVAACLDVDIFWLDFLDAIYRGKPARYMDSKSLFGDICVEDIHLIGSLNKTLQSVLQQAPQAKYYLPLGIGRHVDHQICSLAGLQLMQSGANVQFYDDLPYALLPQATEKRLHELGGFWYPTYVEIFSFLQGKGDVALCYQSQLSLFGNVLSMREAFEGYHKSLLSSHYSFYERFWILMVS